MAIKPKTTESFGPPKENPEINAKIDAYAKANPEKVAFFENLDKKRLVRMLLKRNMQNEEKQQRRVDSTYANSYKWLNGQPEQVTAIIERAVNKVPEQHQKRALIREVEKAQQAIGQAVSHRLGMST